MDNGFRIEKYIKIPMSKVTLKEKQMLSDDFYREVMNEVVTPAHRNP
jgi:hypothetical protein